MDDITTKAWNASHEQRIREYRKRVRLGRDIWSGQPLTTEIVRHAALCLNCSSWFWSVSEGKSVFEFCTDNCRSTFHRTNPVGKRVPPKQKEQQVVDALKELGEPSSPAMIAVVIMGTGHTWAHQVKHFDRTVSSSALRKVIKRLESKGVISQVGSEARPKYLAG